MGLGYALTEDFPTDPETGFPTFSTLRQLGIPGAKDVPEIEVRLVEVPQPRSPFGIKGVGEIGLVPTAPAVPPPCTISTASGAPRSRCAPADVSSIRVFDAIRVSGLGMPWAKHSDGFEHSMSFAHEDARAGAAGTDAIAGVVERRRTATGSHSRCSRRGRRAGAPARRSRRRDATATTARAGTSPCGSGSGCPAVSPARRGSPTARARRAGGLDEGDAT